MDLLARVLDLPGRDFEGVYDWVLRFREDLGTPDRLSALDVPTDRAAHIGDLAARDPSAGSNPIPLDAHAYAALFTAAVVGE